MSERGSFVTEYLHCDECLAAVKAVLLGKDKFLCSTVLPGWWGEGAELPILAGKIGGLYAGEELSDFENDFVPKLEKTCCHPVRIAVLCESFGERIFTVNPNGSTT